MDEITILIIEDDEDIRESVKILLENEGFHVIEADNGMDGLHQISEDTDLVILDIMMPGISGIKTCEQIRKVSYVPILFLTAKLKEEDKVTGLVAGADDYLVKPFALEELHARIRALLRRHNNQGESELIVGNLTLNMGRRQVWMGGEELILTPKEYALLSRLMLKAGSPVHREILYNDIYNWDNEPSTNTLEVHIHNLRDKVGKARIRTVRGFGYMLVANEEN